MSSGVAAPTRNVNRYVAMVALLGSAAMAIAVVSLPIADADLATVGALAVACVVGIGVPLRFKRGGGDTAFTLEAAVFVAMLFTLPGALPPVVLVATSLVADLVQRRPPVKLAFNVGTSALWASSATLVFHVIGPAGGVFGVRSLIAIFAATVLVETINAVSIAELFHRLDGTSRWSTLVEVAPMYSVMWVGNTSFGLLLAFVAMESPIATVLASLLLVGLYLGYRGYAGVVEERARADRLHDITSSLGSATGDRGALSAFVRSLAETFGGEHAELVIDRADVRTHLRAGEAGIEEVRDGRLSDPVESAMAEGTPVRVSMSSSGTGATRYRDAIAAPLLVDGAVIGALAVYDRRGLEPWDDTDATLLATLAHEAAVALRNVELVAELSDESRKLGDIVGAASDGIVLLDADGSVQSWNPGMAQATGVAESEALGQAWERVIPQDPEHDELRPAIDATLAGGTSQVVDVPLLVASERRWLRCTLSPVLREGAIGGAVLICRDVTAQLEADALKSDFVATVSHELRTPLTPLKGFITTMRGRWEQMRPEQVDGALDAMNRQVERLEALVADLLVVADLDRGELGVELQRIDVSAVVSAAVEAETLTGGGDRVEVATRPAHAETDPRHVTRIARALVSNALKHTEGTVRVRVDRGDGRVTIEVADGGPGIAAWDQERIFHRFGRTGDHLVRPTQGPGLGLAIARSLSEAIGAELSVESRPGEGATFTLSVPATDLMTVVA